MLPRKQTAARLSAGAAEKKNLARRSESNYLAPDFSRLAPALQQASAVLTGNVVESETARLRGLLLEVAHFDALQTNGSAFAQVQAWVVLVNPDVDLVRLTARQAPHKKLVLHFDNTIRSAEVGARKSALRDIHATWIHETRPGDLRLEAYVKALRQSEKLTNADLVQVHASAAMTQVLSARERSQIVAKLLGADSQRVVIYGNGTVNLRGVRQESIVDMLERLQLAQFMTSRSV